ncbi:unnamed protein product [Mesocestoides corti]|uniref:Uncharacterized protein n=1 Tax=Mesocestoides corti TaxID=53468 RepID=A0A0R3UFT3_MESCO|nr:unnamed protein product [Mesocestoides corti]
MAACFDINKNVTKVVFGFLCPCLSFLDAIEKQLYSLQLHPPTLEDRPIKEHLRIIGRGPHEGNIEFNLSSLT